MRRFQTASRRSRFVPSVQAPLRRRGTALIVAIVALVLVTAICFSLVRLTLASAQQAERQHWRRQAVWLAESALAEAAVRLRTNPDATGDNLDARMPESAGEVTGRVQVDVVATADNNLQQRVITATADVPLHPTDRVRITRTLTLKVPESRPAEAEEL